MEIIGNGVDIIQNCEVKGIKRNGDQEEGDDTTKGFIKSKVLNPAST